MDPQNHWVIEAEFFLSRVFRFTGPWAHLHGPISLHGAHNELNHAVHTER